jgi:hypothetical protein
MARVTRQIETSALTMASTKTIKQMARGSTSGQTDPSTKGPGVTDTFTVLAPRSQLTKRPFIQVIGEMDFPTEKVRLSTAMRAGTRDSGKTASLTDRARSRMLMARSMKVSGGTVRPLGRELRPSRKFCMIRPRSHLLSRDNG